MPWESGLEEGVHRSDVRTVTVTLSSGNFRINYATPIDEKGVERSYFAVDEKVRMIISVTNRGTVKDDCTFKITDSDTGELLYETSQAGLVPDKIFTMNMPVGTMPNHDWRLLVEVSP